jgi:hypothetical protein
MCQQLGVCCIVLLVLDLTYLMQHVLWHGSMAVQQDGIGHAFSMYCIICIVLHYQAGTTGKGIAYGQDNGLQALGMHALPLKKGRREEGKNSVTGWVVSINGGAASWDSRKQRLLSHLVRQST